MRFDFQLKNALDEVFNISVYIPCTETEKLKEEIDYLIYAHTHNGNRLEGLYMAERVLKNNIGFVTLDFRANGFSKGDYVTLGWFETLDLNEVVRFLKQEANARSISITGRSMGGASVLYFLSEKFRENLNKFLEKNR